MILSENAIISKDIILIYRKVNTKVDMYQLICKKKMRKKADILIDIQKKRDINNETAIIIKENLDKKN